MGFLLSSGKHHYGCAGRRSIKSCFRNVSFKYPDREEYALRNVSFRIEQGHLCVRMPFVHSRELLMVRLGYCGN